MVHWLRYNKQNNMQINFQRALSVFLITLILIIAILLRLYRFSNPIADWHSWRQVDTSSVSRMFVEKGYDLLHPRFHDLSNVPSGKDNPEGYRFVEFPLYNLLQAGFYDLLGVFSLEEWGRIVSILSSLMTILFIFFILKDFVDDKAAYFGALFYALAPFSVYYGRAILPDQTMIMAVFGSIYFFSKWIRSKDTSILSIWYWLSLLFVTSSLLLKPYAIFFTLPLIYLSIQKFGMRAFIDWRLLFFSFVAVVPLVAWRIWMLQYPEGIPANTWLFNSGNIRFKGAYFYWIFGERVAKLILGYWGVSLFILGVIYTLQKKLIYPLRSSTGVFLLSFLFSSLAYLFIIARGNVQHDYYQILIVPSLAIFVGLGASFLLSQFKLVKGISWLFVISILALSLFLSWYHVRDFFNINNPSIIAAGKAVDALTPKNAKILAIYNGDTTLLYQTKRSGWASFEKSLPEMINMGADFLVFVNPNQSELSLADKYQIVSKTSEYVIYNLRERP